jgi:hypothetical protein
VASAGDTATSDDDVDGPSGHGERLRGIILCGNQKTIKQNQMVNQVG